MCGHACGRDSLCLPLDRGEHRHSYHDSESANESNDSTGFGDVSVALPVGTDLWLGDFDGQDIAIEPNPLRWSGD